jgi:hypothetical protein
MKTTTKDIHTIIEILIKKNKYILFIKNGNCDFYKIQTKQNQYLLRALKEEWINGEIK